MLVIAGAILFQGASFFDDFGNDFDNAAGELAANGFANMLAGGLFIAGGVMLVGRKPLGRGLYLAATAITIILGLYWSFRWNDEVGSDAAGLVFWALMFATPVIVGASLLSTAAVRRWLTPTS